jgi:hypothetical protein
MKLSPKISLVIICSFFLIKGYSQDTKDSNFINNLNLGSRSSFINNIFLDAVNSIIRDKNDTGANQNVLILKSEQTFSRFEGKIIRHISIKQFGFEKTFLDTSNRINYIGTRILNSLHTNTKEWVIRDNLFVRENSILNPYKLADNERHLRSLDFIQDARIFVTPIGKDSVDLMVITKDLFSITGVIDLGGTKSVRLRLAEANFLGIGQRIQATGLWEERRSPRTGYEFLYSKTNFGGSFINGTIAYSQINGGRGFGTEDENAFLVRIDRPLVSAFSHVAGSVEFSRNESQNVYQAPDSVFLNYGYNYFESWIGYNLGTRKLLDENYYNPDRTRIFVSVGYLQTDFFRDPLQVTGFDPIYNDKKGILGQINLFRQDFYKLNYIYGFGTTEDVPMGFNISLTSGLYKQLALERPYLGFQLQHYLVTPKGGFVESSFKMGGFYRNNNFEDASTLANVNFFTRIFYLSKYKLREYARINYTQLDRRVIYDQLKVNNGYGFNELSTDSIFGNKRINLYSESILYTNKKIFGFRFAPFVFGDIILIAHENLPFSKSDIYSAVGSGLRTRNENLIFGTIELKAIYFPRTAFDIDKFRVVISSDLKFRYRASFVKGPNIINLNQDDQ